MQPLNDENKPNAYLVKIFEKFPQFRNVKQRVSAVHVLEISFFELCLRGLFSLSDRACVVGLQEYYSQMTPLRNNTYIGES